MLYYRMEKGAHIFFKSQVKAKHLRITLNPAIFS